MPMALMGYTALSVLRTIIFFTPHGQGGIHDIFRTQAFRSNASNGKNSQEGTCFKRRGMKNKINAGHSSLGASPDFERHR